MHNADESDFEKKHGKVQFSLRGLQDVAFVRQLDGEDIEAHRHERWDDLHADGSMEGPEPHAYDGEGIDIGVGVTYSPCSICGYGPNVKHHTNRDEVS